MRLTVLLLLSLLFAIQAFAQRPEPILRQGNKAYNEENFRMAETDYRRALEQNPQDTRAMYNLANVLYRQGRFDEASDLLEGLANLNLSDNKKADVLHNLGNARVKEQKFKEGIDAYKNSLRIRPQDMDTRHNLQYARQLLQQQEQQQQQQQDQDENDDQDQNQQQQPDTPEDQQQDQQEQQPQPRPDQISPQDAERILDALNQQEQNIQEKIDREEKQRAPGRVLKEW